jgi:hypothetical protein
MDMDTLLAGLRSAGVNDRYYEINGRCPGPSPAEGALYVRPEDDRWVVGTLERGVYEPMRTFATEEEAGDFMCERLTRPLPEPRRLTPEEEEDARRRTAASAAEIEARLAAAEADDNDEGSPS